MLGNITSDLNSLLTDLCPHDKRDNSIRNETRNKSGTIHSEDTLGKDSFLSSAGNTSRTRGNRIGSDPSLVSSLENIDPQDCDSVDSGHDGRCRPGPSPLVFDPNHFGRPCKQIAGPVTFRVDVSSGMEECRSISNLERLVKTNSIWLLSSLSRAGAVHLLKDLGTGIFIVRKSSQANSLALSVQNRLVGHPTVDHYLIEGTDFGFRLQGSSHYFHSVPHLIAFYMENREDIPYLLQLPSSIQDCRSLRELASLAMLGQDFWQSPISRKSPTPSFESRSSIQKSCSEPIDIQQPFHPTPQSEASSRMLHNTLPSRTPTGFSHFMHSSQNQMDHYFQQQAHHASSNEHQSKMGTGNSWEQLGTQAPQNSTINMVQHCITTSSTHCKGTTTVVSNQQHTHKQEDTPPFPVGTFVTPQSCSRDSPSQSGSHSSIHQHCHQPPQHSHQGQAISQSPFSMSSSYPVPNSSKLFTLPEQSERTGVVTTSQSYHSSCQIQRAISATTADISKPYDNHPHKCTLRTPPRGEPKPKSNLYSTMNLDLLEIPENRYFKSSLADKLSDYEDVWKNNCDSDVSYVAKQINDPRSVFDSKPKSSRNNRHNPMIAKDGRRKVFKKTNKDTKPIRETKLPRDSVTGGRTGLTALERARLIAGSTSDEEALSPPIAHVKGIQRMENIFNDSVFSKSEPQTVATTSFQPPSSPSSPTVPADDTFVKETHIGSIHISNSNSPHHIKFVTSHSLDFSQKSENGEIPSVPISRKDSPSKCVFTTTMSVIMSESVSSERTATVTNSKPIPGPITNLSKLKSSSESSLATVSSPLYLEPADAVKLRDKNGRAVNIHVRRRSAPSAPNQVDKGQSSKVSQQTPLETIFSPNESNKQNGLDSVEPTFIFDHISPVKPSKSKVALTRSISAAPESTNIQRKHSWKDRLNRLKLGTKVLTQNLTPPAVLNNRSQSMMAKQRPVLENLALSYSEEQDKSLINSPSIASPGPFPLDVSSSPLRASCFSDNSTVQDLISSTHPELAVKPIIPQPSHGMPRGKLRPAPPLSEYDNLGGYRDSTHSSQGTIYSPPWESSSAHKLLLPGSQLPPAMDLNERVQRWQIANSGYHLEDMKDSPVKKKNDKGKSSKLSHHQITMDRISKSEAPKIDKSLETLDDDLHITESHDIKPSSPDSSFKTPINLGSSQIFDNAAVPSLAHQNSMESSFPQPNSPSHIPPCSTPLLSSHHPDVVNCHHAPMSSSITLPGEGLQSTTLIRDESQGEEDILFGADMVYASSELTQKMRPVLYKKETESVKASGPAGSRIREYIFRLSGDNRTMFGSTIGNFIQCTIESHETNPSHVMRNVRQFMTGIKNYLVKHGEGQLEDMIECERKKLAANEILNIDAIIEQALHVCVLKPLKTHIYKLSVNHYSQSGALQELSRNIKYARSRSAQELGVKPGLKLPNTSDMEVIGHHLNQMQKSYSPLQKLNSLLKATSTIYHCVQGKELLPSQGPMSLGADDFLPMLIFVIVHSGLVAAEIEADFMWGLLQPSLLTGEGGYYLTTLSSAVLVLKNFQDTHQVTPGQIEMRLPAISDMQGFLKIAIPNETRGSISWKTLPVRPSMNTRDVCAMVAHKFKITNPQDYGLFLLCDGEENQMAESDCPQLIKGDNQAKNKDCYFAFKRLDATIAWPPCMKQSPVTAVEN